MEHLSYKTVERVIWQVWGKVRSAGQGQRVGGGAVRHWRNEWEGYYFPDKSGKCMARGSVGSYSPDKSGEYQRTWRDIADLMQGSIDGFSDGVIVLSKKGE